MMADLQNALLIHNPNAGTGGRGRRRLLDEARRMLSAEGIEADLAETPGPGDATELASRASNEGRQLVIACGANRTLNAALNSLPRQPNSHTLPPPLLPLLT